MFPRLTGSMSCARRTLAEGSDDQSGLEHLESLKLTLGRLSISGE